MNYLDLVSRNTSCISDELQNKIKNAKVLIIGCGLGSQIAVLAARTGFCNFSLVDGDMVEPHNLNRQAFFYRHLGKNKAEALTEILKEINPSINIETNNFFITNKNLKVVKGMVEKSDFVVNMLDPNEIMYFVNDYCQYKKKIVCFPVNLIWGGYVLFFSHKTPTLKKILGKTVFGKEFYIELIKSTFYNLPPSLTSYYGRFENEILDWPFFPQLGAATNLNSSIVIAGMVKFLDTGAVKSAPMPTYLDLWQEVS